MILAEHLGLHNAKPGQLEEMTVLLSNEPIPLASTVFCLFLLLIYRQIVNASLQQPVHTVFVSFSMCHFLTCLYSLSTSSRKFNHLRASLKE